MTGENACNVRSKCIMRCSFQLVGSRVRSARAMELLSPALDEIPPRLPQDADTDGPSQDCVT